MGVGHRLEPSDARPVQRLRDGDMCHLRVSGGPVPMLHTWRDPDGVADLDRLSRLSDELDPAITLGDDQELAERMRVPVGARARPKGDGGAAETRSAGALEGGSDGKPSR